MIRTLEDLSRQKEALFLKHPSLRDLRIATLQEAGWNHRRLSDFIESCWRGYYQPEEFRVVFSPEFLEWQMPELRGICALDGEGKVFGCVIFFRRRYSRGDQLRTFAIETAICTITNYRGRGIAQYLSIVHQEALIQAGEDFSFRWLDSRKQQEGSSSHVFGQNRERIWATTTMSLLGKSFDWRKSRKYGQLNIFFTLAARGIQKLFPSRCGQTFPGGRRVQTGALEYLPAVRELIDAADRTLPLRRVYDDGELARMIRFRKNDFHALSYCLLDEDGRAEGFLYGYKLPLGEGDCAFFVDGIIFRRGLSFGLRWRFLSECEGRLWEEEGCICATLAATACPENLLKYGYVPFERQVLGVEPYVEMDLSSQNLRGLRIELR